MAEIVGILDYQAGNIKSMSAAIRYNGATPKIVSRPEECLHVDRLIFPGVGDARFASETIQDIGLDDALRSFAKSGKPLLGVCVGAQLLLDHSEERDAKGLGIIPGITRRFPETVGKIPHMGWNQISHGNNHPLLNDIPSNSEVYFVHSYYPVPQRKEDVLTETDYTIRFASSFLHENVFGTQFHPEKSGRTGLRILKNFLLWGV